MPRKHTPVPPFTVIAETTPGMPVWDRHDRPFADLEQARTCARIWATGRKPRIKTEIYDSAGFLIEKV